MDLLVEPLRIGIPDCALGSRRHNGEVHVIR
jgi:hypothetical protein